MAGTCTSPLMPTRPAARRQQGPSPHPLFVPPPPRLCGRHPQGHSRLHKLWLGDNGVSPRTGRWLAKCMQQVKGLVLDTANSDDDDDDDERSREYDYYDNYEYHRKEFSEEEDNSV